MILSTLETRREIQKFYINKRVIPYSFVTLFCILFSFIYAQFSHGVSSPHMTYLFLYPLLLGVAVGLLLFTYEKPKIEHFWQSHFYHTGVVALMLGSILRGVFDIAGTASNYQIALTAGGAGMLFCGVIGFVHSKIKCKENIP